MRPAEGGTFIGSETIESSTSQRSYGKVTGFLLGEYVIVTNLNAVKLIYSEGFYGTPIGVEKPRGADFEAPLELTLIEALYLLEKGVLEVRKLSGERVELSELKELLESREELKLKYIVYKNLRDKKFIVRSGLKFGSPFTIYRVGPGLEHAPYVLHVYKGNERIDPVEIVRAGRLSHSVRKAFILAFPSKNNKVIFLILDWIRL